MGVREGGGDREVKGSSVTGMKGKLQFHSCLTLMEHSSHLLKVCLLEDSNVGGPPVFTE